MTTLYKPVLIETAEQAEALPIGTPFLTFRTDPGKDPLVVEADFVDGINDYDLTPGWNWHCVALVPIEAKEETSEALDHAEAGAYLGSMPAQTRYVTPWESV